MNTTPPLPPGFTLDAQTSAGVPPPPAGFVLDSAQGQQQPAQSAAGPAPVNDKAYHSPIPGGDAINAFGASVAENIPILGPLMTKAADAIGPQIGSLLSGKSPQDVSQQGVALRAQEQSQHPAASGAGTVAGVVGPFLGISGTGGAAKALGMAGTGGLMSRSLLSGGTNATLSGADTLVRTGDPGEALKSAAIGGVGGLVMPGMSDAISAGGRAIGDTVGNLVRSIKDPRGQAGRMVANTIAHDASISPAQMLKSTDVSIAKTNNQPLLNIDYGGPSTRALFKAAANQSPDAFGKVSTVVQDRYHGQSGRFIDVIKRITNGKVDDLQAQEALTAAAKAANDPAYKAAMNSPEAQSVFSKPIQELMQSKDFQGIIAGAERASTTQSAIEGAKAVKNPFHLAPDGNWKLRTTGDGTTVMPNLAFWDVVKKQIDKKIAVALRAGGGAVAGPWIGMKNKLVAALDAQVPQYANARAGAAGFFGAKDALGAGKVFYNQPRQIPEATRAIAKMGDAEKQLFSVGYASEMIDALKVPGNSRNLINSLDTPARQEQMRLVFGPQGAKQMEGFLRLESIMDNGRKILQGSDTARNLAVMQQVGTGAIGGVAGYALDPSHDPKSFLIGMVAPWLVRTGSSKLSSQITGKVMTEIADILTSSDPKVIQKVLANASMSPKHMEALKMIGEALAAGSTAAPLALSRAASQ